ncbi:hypothetical protein [Flavobacterium coralii]|uniref:hypothetical protein n=1 Tax=Flavobacterium coralii TaxID=2838017 RepID=UPI0026A454D3
MKERINNVINAFNIALLDGLYSSEEIISIIRNNSQLKEVFTEDQLAHEPLREIMFGGKDILQGNSGNVLFELIRKKIDNPYFRDHITVLKILETMTWASMVNNSKADEIESLITFFEEEQYMQITPAVMQRVKKCVAGYEDFDIDTYLVDETV